MRVLLIEPDKTLAYLYQTALEESGHKVSCSPSAQAAILAASAFKPDAVVLELQLAAHNGVEFLFEFRSYADWSAVPLVILSHVLPDFPWEKLGVSAYLYKPQTKLKDLVQTVDSLVVVAK